MISCFRGTASRTLSSTSWRIVSWARGANIARPMSTSVQHNVAHIQPGWGNNYQAASNLTLAEEGSVFMRMLEAMNRNARKGRRANKGKRPCSRHRRR